jgi:hypothetical protein
VTYVRPSQSVTDSNARPAGANHRHFVVCHRAPLPKGKSA